ncbi:MAG: type II toxin-antitoxin system VapC family toxin [Deltaproteobacteria bacterium]|jgi:PIN domain nuclease of toxin-antitoxin system|nr:type II toxin-antitoxin system VapC family toxin [Deltaproteobacteria bacterium]
MKLLLDTHMLLWAAAGTLPEKVEKLVVDGDNTIYFSAASIWEINIKKGLGRSDFTVNPEVLRRGLLDNQYQELPITGLHCLAVSDLPMLHKDPFDRILLAQAKVEGIPLVTADSIMRKYPAPIIYPWRRGSA